MKYYNSLFVMQWSFVSLVAFFLSGGNLTASGGTLFYTGEPFTNTSAGPGNLEAVITFSAPITNGATLTEANVIDFTVSAAGRTISLSDTPSFFDMEFTFGPSLLPTSWGLVVEADIEGDSEPEQFFSFRTPNSIFGQTADGFLESDSMIGIANLGQHGEPDSFILEDNGIWAVPEPSSLALVLVAVLCLWIGKRRIR